jgi:hypothetical protein
MFAAVLARRLSTFRLPFFHEDSVTVFIATSHLSAQKAPVRAV